MALATAVQAMPAACCCWWEDVWMAGHAEASLVIARLISVQAPQYIGAMKTSPEATVLEM